MEWFKHKTGSLDDPDFNLILDEFGSDGYMMFFGFLEIYGKEYSNVDSDGFLHISSGFVARKLRKSSAKVKKFLSFCQEKLNKSPWEYSLNGNSISYKVPKFIDLSSNWTKRKHGRPTEAPTEAPLKNHTPEVEEEIKKKINKEIKDNSANEPFYLTYKKKKLKGKRLETFDLFWAAFGYKKSRAAAADSWLDIPELTDSIVEHICLGAKTAAKERPAIFNKGSTPKMAQGWLSERRWEDEPYVNPNPTVKYNKF